MAKRILFCDNWLFHDGEIETQRPALKAPVYTQAKTETYRNGPASIYYLDTPDDFGTRPLAMLTHEKWETVTLPHDYIVNSPIDSSENNALGFRRYRPAWYRKHFKAEEDWRGSRVEIEFLGIATECDIYLNGVWLCHNETQYTPINVDITDLVQYGGKDNVFAVHVTQRTIENWWYNGGGICHKAYITVSPSLSLERDGVFVAPVKIEDGEWSVPVSAEIRNDRYTDAEAELVTELLDREGNTIATLSSRAHVPAREVINLKLDPAKVTSPHLWDIDDPYLHTARTRVYADGVLCDERLDDFGFRTIEFTVDRGFVLNGRPRYIKGICGHEDFGLTGKAVPDNVMRHKVRLLKEMGVNAYRCAHSMQDEALMDAFDRYGMMVMAETRHFSTAETHIKELRALIRRDRNRPSVFMWSVGNEEHYFVTDEGRRIAENMIFEVKRLDSTRPVMTANDKSPELCTVYEVSDLVAVNYNHHLYDFLHEKFPNKPIFSSECSAASSTRGWYFDTCHQLGRMTAYDTDTNSWFLSHENTFKGFRERPYIMGAFLWSAFEYLGEAKWPRICSCSGAIDLYMQKKDAFYQIKSFYDEAPMVHVMPHWNMEGFRDVRVVAYTNCASVELFLNGRSLGRQSCEKYIHNEWHTPSEAGELRAVAYDACGNRAAEDVKTTSGRPYALRLRCENQSDLCANGEDLALFTCYAVDEKGIEVPDAECTVTFIPNQGAKIIGTGSDHTDHIPPSSPIRRMYAGRVLAALMPMSAGKLTLHAIADGLKSASITVDIPEDRAPALGRVYPKENLKW